MSDQYYPDPCSPFILELSSGVARITRTQYGSPVRLAKDFGRFCRVGIVRKAKFSERFAMEKAYLSLPHDSATQLQHKSPHVTELRPREAGPGPYPDGDWTQIDPRTGEFELPDGVFELLRLTGVMVSLDVINGFKLYYKHPSGSTYVCCYKIKPTIEDWASACQHLMNHAEEQWAPMQTAP